MKLVDVCEHIGLMFLIVKSLLVTGAVFNLLCGETDNVVMRKIEDYFQHKVPEVSSNDAKRLLFLS